MKHSKKGHSPLEKYEQHFPTMLRQLMSENGTTQKELGQYANVRPQTISLYCNGETQPNCDTLLKIAEYFHVTVDYLLTGTIIENIPIYKQLGFTENTVRNIQLVQKGYFEDTPDMLEMLDCLLSDKDFYLALEKAAYWNSQKKHTSKDKDDNKEWIDYCEWKASQYMLGYFIEFFGYGDFKAIYKAYDERG